MKLVSFNSNSIRIRMHQLASIINTHQPDIIGVQETKVTDQDFPLAEINALGYHAEYYGQKTHYGVALLSKNPPIRVQRGYPHDKEDTQRRFIAATYALPQGKELTVINGYFPQGESRDHPIKFPNKQQFYADLLSYLREFHQPSDQLVVMGDMNISPEDIDIGIGEENRKRWLRTGKCSFLPEEREWLAALKEWGLADTYRFHNPDQSGFSWFDYRSKGFEQEPKRGLRIDLIMATECIAKACISTGIDCDVRAMDKPSDHAPVWFEFK